MEVRGEKSIDRGECGVLMDEEWLQLVEYLVGGEVGCGWRLLVWWWVALYSLYIAGCRVMDMVGGWLFTVCMVWVALFTDFTGHCCGCTV